MASQLHQRQDFKAVDQPFTVDVGDETKVLRFKGVPSTSADSTIIKVAGGGTAAAGAATHSIKVEIYDTSDGSTATGYINVIAES